MSDTETNAAILQELLKIIPCSYVPNHTIGNLPSIVQGLVDQSIQLSRIVDKVISFKDETTEEEIISLLDLILE